MKIVTFLVAAWFALASPLHAYTQNSDRYDKYGGYKEIRRKATGYFRLERVNGRSMFITPEGHGYLAIGANHVGKFFESPEDSAALLRRFKGNRTDAQREILRAMSDVALNAGEAYGPLLDSLKPHMPYVEYVPFPEDNKWKFDIFDMTVQDRIRRHVVEYCRKFANNKMVLGVGFADLPVWNEQRMQFIRMLPAQAAGKRRWLAWLRSKHGNIEALNRAYGTSFRSFDDLAAPRELAANAAVRSDDEQFLAVMAEELYRLLRGATNEGTPHHLFFGEKFVARLYPAPVIRAVGKYVDVFLTQALILSPQRPPEWQVFQPEAYSRDHEITGGKPLIVVDWAPPFSLDETYQTERGEVREEKRASDEAAQWISEAFQEPYIIGVFACQLIGTHGNDRWFPKGRMKRTLVRDDATPFAYRTQRMKEAHRETLRREYDRYSDRATRQQSK